MSDEDPVAELRAEQQAILTAWAVRCLEVASEHSRVLQESCLEVSFRVAAEHLEGGGVPFQSRAVDAVVDLVRLAQRADEMLAQEVRELKAAAETIQTQQAVASCARLNPILH